MHAVSPFSISSVSFGCIRHVVVLEADWSMMASLNIRKRHYRGIPRHKRSTSWSCEGFLLFCTGASSVILYGLRLDQFKKCREMKLERNQVKMFRWISNVTPEDNFHVVKFENKLQLNTTWNVYRMKDYYGLVI